MNLKHKLMRFLAPACEKQRMEFRYGLAKLEAHTEDFSRTVRLTPEQIEQWKLPSPPSKS
jgi:hypothetical protein